MNLFKEYRKLVSESVTKYTSGKGLLAKVNSTGDKHTVTFMLHGKPQNYSDTEFSKEQDAHDFAQDEVDKHRIDTLNKTVESVEPLNERRRQPSPNNVGDPIEDDTKNRGTGTGTKNRIHKQMDPRRTEVEVIAKILAGK